MQQLFPTQTMLMTSGVQALTLDYDEREVDVRPTFLMLELSELMNKHFANMGEESWKDKKLNKEAIENMSGRVVSSFTLHDKKLYIITDGLHLYGDPEYGKDYPCTTILLREEY